MSNDNLENGLTKKEVLKMPGKLVMFLRFAQFIGEGRASVHEKYKNVILLNSYISNTFSIGRNDDNLEPFIGVQDKMIPWFFEANWNHAYLSPDDGYLYLTAGESLGKGIILGIKIRKKRMSLLWVDEVENERYVSMKAFKMNSKVDYQVSKKSYGAIGLSSLKTIEDLMKDNVEEVESDESDADFSDADLWS